MSFLPNGVLRLPQYELPGADAVRAAPIVGIEPPTEHEAGAVLVMLDEGARYRFRVRPDFFDGGPPRGAMLVVHATTGRRAWQDRATFDQTARRVHPGPLPFGVT